MPPNFHFIETKLKNKLQSKAEIQIKIHFIETKLKNKLQTNQKKLQKNQKKLQTNQKKLQTVKSRNPKPKFIVLK